MARPPWWVRWFDGVVVAAFVAGTASWWLYIAECVVSAAHLFRAARILWMLWVGSLTLFAVLLAACAVLTVLGRDR